MNKKDRIQYLLSLMEQEIEEILNEPMMEAFTAEETINLALELVSNQEFNRPKTYQSPIAQVDKDKVQFFLDEDFPVPLYTEDGNDEGNLF